MSLLLVPTMINTHITLMMIRLRTRKKKREKKINNKNYTREGWILREKKKEKKINNKNYTWEVEFNIIEDPGFSLRLSSPSKEEMWYNSTSIGLQ
jgi:hypothetical protein